ncbi:MAG: Holliday junction resolvase RuvX [Acidimicrobiaceae bacterium]|nr:Holliday junction resolvase RuvX [Acidimicrobiaceae bacterium]
MARILALDPGTRRCGVALSDTEETLAFPRPALEVDMRLIGEIRRLCDDDGVELVVVGRPRSLAGQETASTHVADEFFHALETALEIPVIQADERLTTATASRQLRDAGVSAKAQRARVDSAAAVVLLESVLEARRAE